MTYIMPFLIYWVSSFYFCYFYAACKHDSFNIYILFQRLQFHSISRQIVGDEHEVVNNNSNKNIELSFCLTREQKTRVETEMIG